MTVDEPKTKALSDRLKKLGMSNVMIITGEIGSNFHLSSRNIPNVKVVEAHSADPVNLLRFDKILLTKSGIVKFEELMA